MAVNRDSEAGGAQTAPHAAGAVAREDNNSGPTNREIEAVRAAEGPDADPVPPGSREESDGRAVRAQARREQRRGTILVAATQVFKDKGYHATSVNDIIDAAQIARGTFYLYFTSKRDVFAELSSTFLALIRGSVRKISLDPADGEPLAQMRANFRRVMNTVLEHGDLATIMLRGDAGDAEARAHMAPFYEQVVDLIGQAVRVGRTLGIARDCDVEVIAVAGLAGLKEVLGRMLEARRRPGAGEGAEEGAAVGAGVGQDGVPQAIEGREAIWRTSPERLADELLTFFVRGVFTRGHALG